MKRILSVLCAVMLIVVSSHAESDKKNDLAVNVGLWSAPALVVQTSQILLEMTSLKGKIDIADTKYYGNYGLTYHHQTKWWMRVGVKLKYEFMGFDVNCTDPEATPYIGQRAYLGTSKTHMCQAMASLQFTYLNTTWVKLYSGLDLGLGVAVWDKKISDDPKVRSYYEKQDIDIKEGVDPHFFPAFDLTVLGLNVGKTVYGLVEINLGTDALLLAGLGVHF